MKNILSPVLVVHPFGKLVLPEPKKNWCGLNDLFVCRMIALELMSAAGIVNESLFNCSIGGEKVRLTFSKRPSAKSLKFQIFRMVDDSRPRAEYYGPKSKISSGTYANFGVWAVRRLKLTHTPQTFYVRLEVCK